MLRNMNFWDDSARRLEQRLFELMDRQYESGLTEKQSQELMTLMKNNLVARENAQRCAVDAAPYVHAKFQSITFRDERDEPSGDQIQEVTLALPAPAGENRSYRDGWKDPIVKDEKAEVVDLIRKTGTE